MTPAIHTAFRSRSVFGLTFDHTYRNQMLLKRSIRPLFSAVFVFAAAAVTLCLRIIVSGAGRDGVSVSLSVSVLPSPVALNQTLLTFASVDLADDSLRQNVEHLVDEDFRKPNSNLLRSFPPAERYRHRYRYRYRHRLDTGARYVNGGPPELDFDKLRLFFRRDLNNWWRKRRFDPDVMSNLIMKTSSSSLSSSLSSITGERKHKTCAVVGNSGILLKSRQGEAIDAHEFIIRLNNARIGGYERFVGSKTSLSFMNSNILHLCSRRTNCFCHPYGEKVPIIIYMSQPIHFLDYTVCNSSHRSPLLITDPQLDILCTRIVKYYSAKRFLIDTGKPLESWSLSHGGSEFHYSSGMQAIMLALGICEKVSIFGFGKSDSAKHHYHTNQKTELSLHDYQAEYDLYEDLVQNPEAVPFVSGKFKFPPVIIHR